MNHFKTFIFLLAIGFLLKPGPCYAKLQRKLQPNEISALKNNVVLNPKNIQARLFLGNHYYCQQDWPSVIKYLNPIVEDLPDQSLFQLSHSYTKINEYRGSEAIVNILLSKKKVSVKSQLLAVEIYSGLIQNSSDELKRTDLRSQMFSILKAAQKLEPTSQKIYDLWLNMLEEHVPYYSYEALQVIDGMTKNNVKMKRRHYSLQCKYNYLAKFTKETKFSCKRAIVKDPKNPSNRIYLGQTHINIGEEKLGKRMLTNVGKEFTKSEEALWATANSYYESKNIGEAFNYFQKATQHTDAQPRDFLGLAKTAFKLKKYSLALQAFTEHCRKTNYLDQEFRRASGLLKDNSKWQNLFRHRMMDCKPSKLK